MQRLSITVAIGSVLLSIAGFAQSSPSREITATLTKQVTVATRMQYLVVLPRNYTANHAPWPIILYLHGAGDRGTDLSLVRRTAAVQQAKTRADFPFILIAPQVSDLDQSWLYPENREAALAILDQVLREYHGDSNQVYLTGISMGGWGTWFFAYSFPSRFAAIAPLCGFPDVRWARAIVHTPIWTFHGTKDTVAPIIETERMVEELQKLGGDPKYTPVVGGDHDIAEAVYKRDDLYTWFLQHRLHP